MQYGHLCGTRRSSDPNRIRSGNLCAKMRIRRVCWCYCTSRSSSIAVFVVFRLLIIICKDSVDGFSNGIPISSCWPMESIHGVQPQIGNHPFYTYTDKRVVTNNNDDAIQLRLTIKQRSFGDEMAFKGFLLMAFDDANPKNDSIGSFFLPSDGQVIRCPSGTTTNNAVTHQSSEDKRYVTVYWKPPEDFVGSVIFRTTYLKNGTVFWINTPTAYAVRVVNPITTTVSTSTSTEFIPPTTTALLSTEASDSDMTSDGSDVISSTTETMFNTTEEEENSTSTLTTDQATTTSMKTTTNKPPHSGPSSEILLDFYVLLAGLTCCWTVF